MQTSESGGWLVTHWPQVATAIASAALLTGGATIISNKVGVAVLDERVDRLETLNDNVDALRVELQKTREELLRGRGQRE